MRSISMKRNWAETKGLKLIKFCKKISDYDELDVMVRRVPAANYNEDAFAVLWRRAPTLEAEPEDEDVHETVTARTVQTLTNVTVARAADISPATLASAMHAISKMHAAGRAKITGTALEDLAAVVLDRVSELPPAGVAQAAWALPAVGLRPSPALVEGLLARAEETAEDFAADEAATLLASLASAQAAVPPALVETMKGRVAATLDEMGVQAMANFVWALAQLRASIGRELQTKIEERACNRATLFKPQAVQLLMDALAELGAEPGARLVRVMNGRGPKPKLEDD